jgi:sulfatase modifying factor 1
MKVYILLFIIFVSFVSINDAVAIEYADKTFTNSVGMKFVLIPPGEYLMGHDGRAVPEDLIKDMAYPTKEYMRENYPQSDPEGFLINLDNLRYCDPDEYPQHRVIISKPFYMGMYEVTNVDYEKYAPGHRKFRGKGGVSSDDNEAVVYVSWHDAQGFCEWLSEKEGIPYRLPTEAEWEYACRAGTDTLFSTGDSLAEEFRKYDKRVLSFRNLEGVKLTSGQTPANPRGLYDMHGNAEEWCYDWYGPYLHQDQTDPVGYAGGQFKVTRGGSHSTEAYYLRSANRLGDIPEDKNMLIGFRVVIGELPKTKALPEPPEQRYQTGVKQNVPVDITKGPDAEQAYFKGPRKLIKMPKDNRGPLFFYHNHFMSVTDCPNGDILAAWHSCVNEKGRELSVACSRLRYGVEEWEPASVFWDVPDRNDHGHALWNDGKGTLYHFNGLGVTARSVALLKRTSVDNGVSWSAAELIAEDHCQSHQMPVESVFASKEGDYFLACDSGGGSVVWVSQDKGRSWKLPGGRESTARIQGTHAGVVQLDDGRLMGLGRGAPIEGKMPMSISNDMGKTWAYKSTPFPPINSGQRLVLLKLKEGPLFLASFAKEPIMITDVSGKTRPVVGLYSAVSLDEGLTWPHVRVISDDGDGRAIETIGGGLISFDATNSEQMGYLSVCQAQNGVIHLVSSRQHYAFNLKWATTLAKSIPKLPVTRRLERRQYLAQDYKPACMPSLSQVRWRYIGKNVAEADAVSILSAGQMKVSTLKEGYAQWSNDGNKKFNEDIDMSKGCTAEIALQILEDEKRKNGIKLELFIRGGNLTANHYVVEVTAHEIYYLIGRERILIADGLDNATDIHTYRLTVRADTAVQIYRDDRLVSVQPMQSIQVMKGWKTPAQGSFIRWGQEKNSPPFLVEHVSYDLSGPYQPLINGG